MPATRHRHAVDRDDLVLQCEAAARGGGICGDRADDQPLFRGKAHHPEFFAAANLRPNRQVDRRVAPPDGENSFALALLGPAAAEGEVLANLAKRHDFFPVDGQDNIAGFEAGLDRRADDLPAVGGLDRGQDFPDGGGFQAAVRGLANDGDDARERESKEDVERRARHEHDHLGRIADGRQLRHVALHLAFNGAQVGQLGQQDVAAERNPGDPIIHTIASPP